MLINQSSNLNMIPEQCAPVFVHVSQFDVGSRTLKFKLINGSAAFTIPNGMTASFNGIKPDGYVFTYPMTVDQAAGTVAVDVETQMTAVAGDVECEVALFKDSERLGTANLILRVEASPTAEGVVSDSDLPLLEEAISASGVANAQAEIATQKATEAATSASNAATSASHAASSESAAQTYKNQAKTYRDEAAAIVGPVQYAFMVDTDGYICLSYTES